MVPAADRFLHLHQDHFVVKWQWLFTGTMLRAYADTCATATISKGELDDLVAQGAMRWGARQAWVVAEGSKEREVA